MRWPLAWRMSWMLFTVAAGASIIATDSSNPISSYEGTLLLQDLGAKRNISELIPLTRDALLRNRTPLEGDLVYVNESTVTLLRDRNVAYISCDLDHYSGNSTDPALDLFKQAMNIVNLSGVIFFSTEKNFCSYTEIPVLLQEFPVYSMTDRTVSAQVLGRVDDLNPAIIYMVNISSVGPRDQQSQPQNNPLGPSPSTAVAMIILYSITGIITALFLVIIITGAVRAHRHPERYGPRDILGRPRQSRARGLGRAILDTIPIVKFGEREPQKPTDVELGSAREGSEAEPGHAEPGQQEPGASQEQRDAGASEAAAARTATPGQPGTAPAEPVEEPSGIAPAIPTTTAEEEHLECSICTEDFVKGQDLRVLPCGHKFHPECVDPWLLNVSGTCPLCRVDLRPGSARSSSSSTEMEQNELAPPLHPDDSEAAHRRRSGLRDILLFRTRPNASAEERISALRRLRDQRRSEQAAIAGEPAHGESSAEAAADARRSRRFSARLSDVFGARTRRQHGSQEREGRQEGQGPHEAQGEEEPEATMTAAGALPSAERDAEIIDNIVEPAARRRSS